MSIFEKIYNRINWQNKPSTETPINADNLNKMDKAIDDLDGRVVSLSESVNTNTTDISALQSDVSANSEAIEENSNDIATLLDRLTWKTLTHDAVAITQVGEIAFTEIATIPNIDEVNEILIDFGLNNLRIGQLHAYRSGSSFSVTFSNMIVVDAYTLAVEAQIGWVDGIIAIRCLTNTWGLEAVSVTVPANAIHYR